MKRLFDIVVSSLALLALLPLGLVICLVLRFTGEGEVFYRQSRVGRGGRAFGLIKFATMLKNSPQLGTGDITLRRDPRVLPVGSFLRKTKINELPQIINILKGDMSVVGPRPLTPGNFAWYPEEVQKDIAELQPGLTGIGSIFFRDEESIISSSGLEPAECYKRIIAPYKGALEQWYKRNQGAWVDFLIILLTAWVVLLPGSDIYTKVFKDLPEPPDEIALSRIRSGGIISAHPEPANAGGKGTDSGSTQL